MLHFILDIRRTAQHAITRITHQKIKANIDSELMRNIFQQIKAQIKSGVKLRVVFSSGGAKNQSYHDEYINAQNPGSATKLPSSTQILRAIAVATKAKFKGSIEVYLDKLLFLDVQTQVAAGTTWDEIENAIYRGSKPFPENLGVAELRQLSGFLGEHHLQSARIDRYKLLLIWMRMLRIAEIYRAVIGHPPSADNPITSFFYDVESDPLKKITRIFGSVPKILSGHTLLYPLHVLQTDGSLLTDISQIQPITGQTVGVFDYRRSIHTVLARPEIQANGYAALQQADDSVASILQTTVPTYLDLPAVVPASKLSLLARAKSAVKMPHKDKKPLPFNDQVLENLPGVIVIQASDNITIPTRC